ncbi:GtrA family protein [Yersinia alsatica]|uniref:GtrA family protein n=1 Tax=Yersinia alsatica TaxID=2890317 RepID=UPI0011A41E41
MKKANKSIIDLCGHVHFFSKFLLVGGMTMAIYFLFIWVMKTFIGLSYLFTVSLAYFISVLFHFFANKYFTFSISTLGESKAIIVRYLFLLILNYFITISIVGFCVDVLYFSTYISVCISAVFTMCTGYLLARYWVFKN